MTKVDSNKLDAFHHKCLRKVLGVTYLDRIKNSEFLERTKQQKLNEIIRKRRLRWFGHVARMNEERFPKRVLVWETTGKRRPGRPRCSWKQNVSKDLKDLGIKYQMERRLECDEKPE